MAFAHGVHLEVKIAVEVLRVGVHGVVQQPLVGLAGGGETHDVAAGAVPGDDCGAELEPAVDWIAARTGLVGLAEGVVRIAARHVREAEELGVLSLALLARDVGETEREAQG